MQLDKYNNFELAQLEIQLQHNKAQLERDRTCCSIGFAGHDLSHKELTAEIEAVKGHMKRVDEEMRSRGLRFDIPLTFYYTSTRPYDYTRNKHYSD